MITWTSRRKLRHSDKNLHSQEHHNYYSTTCIMIFDGSAARKDSVCGRFTRRHVWLVALVLYYGGSGFEFRSILRMSADDATLKSALPAQCMSCMAWCLTTWTVWSSAWLQTCMVTRRKRVALLLDVLSRCVIVQNGSHTSSWPHWAISFPTLHILNTN